MFFFFRATALFIDEDRVLAESLSFLKRNNQTLLINCSIKISLFPSFSLVHCQDINLTWITIKGTSPSRFLRFLLMCASHCGGRIRRRLKGPLEMSQDESLEPPDAARISLERERERAFSFHAVSQIRSTYCPVRTFANMLVKSM